MLWVLIRSASLAPQCMFSWRNKKDTSTFRLKKVPFLRLWYLFEKKLSTWPILQYVSMYGSVDDINKIPGNKSFCLLSYTLQV